MRATYERYWREFTDRRDGKTAWDVYTPYELRIVGTLVRLGWRDRAQALLAFFLADRRPLAWNQWPEVVGRDPRQPRFVGDMPHAWVSLRFHSRDPAICSRTSATPTTRVVLARRHRARLARPKAASRCRTCARRTDALSYALRRDGDRVTLRLASGSGMPPGGFVFVWPGDKPPRSASINGKPATVSGAEFARRRGAGQRADRRTMTTNKKTERP